MAPQCAVKPIASTAEFKQHISELPADCLAVIYFHASWAEPCRVMSKKLDELAQEFTITDPPQITFLALEAEDLYETSEEYRITQVPSVILQRDSNILEIVKGTDATKVGDAVHKQLGQSAPGTVNRTGLPPAQQLTRPPAPPAGASAASNSDAKENGSSAVEDTKERSKEELDAHLKQLVSAAPVMLFMKGTPSAPQCGFSRKTVAILRENGIKYGFFNILADDEVRQGLKEFSEWPTFPQVYVDGEFVGGLDIVSSKSNKSRICTNGIVAEGGI
jgi:Grx4 family monothiol glutaredoxin